MYVIGHVVTAAAAPVAGRPDLRRGERVIELMLPDLLSCHDWAYAHSWYRQERTRDQLVVAHMVGDAVVHFGRRWDGEHRKRGWAYRTMGQVARRYQHFWDTVDDNGWRLPEAGPPDSRRGWAHTLCEYALDQWLADNGDWDELLAACREQAAGTLADRAWVDAYVEAGTVTPSKPLATQPARYCGAISRACRPDEIHLRGLAVKFGLVESSEVLEWLRGWVRGIVRGVGAQELDAVVTEITETVTEPWAHGYPTAVLSAATIPDPATALAGQAAERAVSPG